MLRSQNNDMFFNVISLAWRLKLKILHVESNFKEVHEFYNIMFFCKLPVIALKALENTPP